MGFFSIPQVQIQSVFGHIYSIFDGIAFCDILWYYTNRAEDNITEGELYFS